MAQTPEQKVHSALKSLFVRSLPKGRWILQRIETSTGNGIPDNYFNLRNWGSMWVETKTTEYNASIDQLNWASVHWLTGGLTYIVTRIKCAQIPAKQGIKHTPTTASNGPFSPSTTVRNSAPYPTLLELLKTPQNNPIQSYYQFVNNRQKGDLVFLSFDDRMRDCSTLGSYMRKYDPDVLLVNDWVTSICARF